MSSYDEIRQRKMNLQRQSAEIASLRDDLKRLEKDIDFELNKRFASQSPSRASTKACYYCAEVISANAKVCPKCRRIFLDYARDVFAIDLRIAEWAKK